jgi:hypothetical protein
MYIKKPEECLINFTFSFLHLKFFSFFSSQAFSPHPYETALLKKDSSFAELSLKKTSLEFELRVSEGVGVLSQQYCDK